MAISGQLNINIGLPNESTGSDSLYTAFTKIEDNFTNVFACASPYANIIAGDGISTDDDSANGNITINNTGVINILPTASINVTDDGNGNFQLSVTMDASGNIVGGVTSVGLQSASSSRLTVTGASPITSTGTWIVDLATSGVTAGSYTYPTMTVDTYGRVTSISSGASVGTVTSVGLTPGAGIQITGSPVTTSGSITVTNTGVTSLTAGTGITLSSSNGAVTISSPTTGGTVTSVAVTSGSLTVTGSPITTSGTIQVEVPTNFVSPGNVTSIGNIKAGIPAKVTLFAANGDVASLGNVSSGGGNALLYANGLITGTDISTSGDLYAAGNANIADSLRVDNSANFYGGIYLIDTSSINFSDSTGSPADTSIYYINSGGSEALVLALNNDNGIEIYNDLVNIAKDLTTSTKVRFAGSVDTLTNGGAANLDRFSTIFSTSAAWTATLAAGTDGQVKTFMMAADGGDMVITVTNAGWKTSGTGTMTFNDIGDACTLQWVNGKWYCIGNNGVVFA